MITRRVEASIRNGRCFYYGDFYRKDDGVCEVHFGTLGGKMGTGNGQSPSYTQSVSKTYGGTKSIDGAIDFDFSLTNMAEGGEVEIGEKMYSVYPAFECNLAYICVEAETGFQIDSLDTPDTYINNKETAYADASKLLVK